MSGETVLRFRQIHLRHIVDVPQGTPGSVALLGRWFAPTDRRGINGPGGFVSAELEERLLEHGTGKLRFPNATGGDGVTHLDRFRCLGSTADAYAPGDEWIEVYEGPPPCGDLLAVVTPLDATVARNGAIDLDCADGFWLGNKMRETTAGHWHHAPRDVIEHYSGAWVADIVEGFDRVDLTYATVDQATADGDWIYRRSQSVAGGVELRSPSAMIRSPLVLGSTWRAEAVISFTAATAAFNFGQMHTSGGMQGPFFTFVPGGQAAAVRGPGQTGVPIVDTTAKSSPVSLAIESRDGWLFFYANGRLVSVQRPSTPGAGIQSFGVATISSSSAPEYWCTVHSILLRQHKAFLMRGPDKGDHRLPGAPTAGGLMGEYFDDADIAGDPDKVLSPLREPYARRLDATLDFAISANPTTWQPTGPTSGGNFSVRWTGAIYLDLAAHDYRIRAASVDDRARVWVAKTQMGEQIINDWTAGHPALDTTSGSLRTQLGMLNGWYPIVIEYGGGAGSNTFSLRYDQDNSGTFTSVPADRLSPLGVYQDHVRHESFHDALEKVASIVGYQYRLEPRQLESGLFPGQLAPRVRVGRDTAHVIGETTSAEPTVKLSAQDVAHTLLIDGAGVSDQAGGAQLTREAVDYAAVGKHLIVHQAAENLADLQAPGLLEQRANSLLTLMSSAWEEVSARDLTDDGPKDAWPLTGQLAALKVGDGARLILPSVGVQDASPRQMLGRTRALVPDGAGVPVARFRQRPRSFRETVRRILKTAIAPQRNYQGALTTTVGSVGSTYANAPADAYTRAVLPANASAIVRADLIVIAKSDASTMTVEVNDAATTTTVTSIGRYDVTAHIARYQGTAQQAFARLTGGTGLYQIALELTVRI